MPRESNDYLRYDVSVDDTDAPIHQFRYVIHGTERQPYTITASHHATVYLILSPSRSVQINMCHDEGDLKGRLELVSRRYEVSTSESGRCIVNVHGGPTLRDIEEVIFDGALNEFIFNNDGKGCTYWQILCAKLFEDKKWTSEGSAAKVHAWMIQKLSRIYAPIQVTISPGTFMHDESQLIADTIWDNLGNFLEGDAWTTRTTLDSLEWLRAWSAMPDRRLQVHQLQRQLAAQGVAAGSRAGIHQQIDRHRQHLEAVQQQYIDWQTTAALSIRLTEARRHAKMIEEARAARAKQQAEEAQKLKERQHAMLGKFSYLAPPEES